MTKNNNYLSFDLLIILALIILTSMALLTHSKIIFSTYPQELREGATLNTTYDIGDGINPYLLKNQPEHAQQYGILYSIVVYPFFKIFGGGLEVHRFVTGVFILLSCLILYLFLRMRKVPKLLSICGIVLLYVSLLFSVTPLTRPDSLGLFLFLLSIYLPEKYHYSYKILIISFLLGLLAFFTKTFFILAFPFLATYIFLFVSKKKAILYTVFSSILSVIIILFISSFVFPTYLSSTFFGAMNGSTYFKYWVIKQLLIFIKSYSFIILIIPFLALSLYIKLEKKIKDELMDFKFVDTILLKINVNECEKPFLLKPLFSGYYYFCMALLILIFKFGGHLGAFMTYFYQLLSPFFILSILESIKTNQRIQNVVRTFFIINIFYFMHLNHLFPNRINNSSNNSQWLEIEHLIITHDKILNTSAAAISPLLLKHHKTVWENGHSESITYAYLPGTIKNIFPFYTPPVSDNELSEAWKSYQEELNRKIIKKEFSLIFTCFDYGHAAFDTLNLKANYKNIHIYILQMPQSSELWNYTLWVPK